MPHESAGQSSAVRAVAFTYLSFALPISMLGVMWEPVSERFNQSPGTLGVAGLFYGVGRLSTATTGQGLVRRFGIPTAIATVLIVLTAASAALAATPFWALFLGAWAVIGACSGSLDSIGAGFIARTEDVRSAGLIHGSYGVGATIGPLVVAVAPSWRMAIAVTAVVTLIAAASVRTVHDGWTTPAPSLDQPEGGAGPVPTGPLPVKTVGLLLLLFGVFVALEVTAGLWLFTFLTEERDLSDTLGRIAVSGFWGGLTIGRLLMSRAGPSALLARMGLARLSLVGCALVLLMVAVRGPVAVALPFLTGLVLAPTIPTLFAQTAQRIGAEHAPRIAGWQLVATNIGAISVPLLVGQWVDAASAAVIPVVLLAVTVTGTTLLFVVGRPGEAPGAAATSPKSATR